MKNIDDFFNEFIDSNCEELGPVRGSVRQEKAYQIKVQVAENHLYTSRSEPTCNSDEQKFANKIGNYTKGLPHNKYGEVNIPAYDALKKALNSGLARDFESIPLGSELKLTNPQAAYAYNLVGPDSHQLSIPAPPSVQTAWHASEMAELYWRALTRDIPFNDYSRNKLINEASKDLTKFSNFKGPKTSLGVTPKTIFRGDAKSDLTGPLVSQLLLTDIPYGNNTLKQRYRTTTKGDDHLTDYKEWLIVQNGHKPNKRNEYDRRYRYIRSSRDLAVWVHRDFSFQAFLNACLILLKYGNEAIDSNNPYLSSKTQVGFITFGAAHILDMVTRAARSALESAWYQKWLVHRRLRPEEYGGLVHNYLMGNTVAPIHEELLESKALQYSKETFGTYLLPIAYAEGCPTHPAYPAGHACIAGAGVTMLKAFFNEGFIIPEPVIPSSDGLSLNPYKSSPLTVSGELNKLASNIALGRDAAGVHWRTDSIEGIKLGEQVALNILKDYKETFNEQFSYFKITLYDGKTVTI
ncbi:vanadium-dependent haloperoxidase [Alkalibacillus haloalkaliphilus]|uniref:vanadium-dependent haloperoxidase n=1 Tax=Alkalibacillus haloalkaliphilus TaxID=94136 RepID=UPI002936918E|nr:vanadium-dependent haloperoxidase [Alkalibacillus haloalkaliphilus]MDV2581502.1 vanadium-dependent haloperoxidase [Alkalibacillus haloalkaliphilus]